MLAVIGGTGFGELAGLQNRQAVSVNTNFGTVYLETGELSGLPLCFLPRHGNPPSNPPHMINYRANIDALSQSGIDEIIAVSAVGSVDPLLGVGDLVVPDQIIDYTSGRESTYFDSELHHIDFTHPYDEKLRQELLMAARDLSQDDCHTSGVYGCTQGPRLETAAEIRRMGIDGCTIVGMTAMPEASLAREKEIAYAGISVIINAGAGLSDDIIDLQAITEVLSEGMTRVASILVRLTEKRS